MTLPASSLSFNIPRVSREFPFLTYCWGSWSVLTAEGSWQCETCGIKWAVAARRRPRTTRTGPFKPRTDEGLALCHPYLQLCCSVHPHHPACARQNGENFPIGADPSGLFFASSWKKCLPIVRLWSHCVLGDFEIKRILQMTRQYRGKKYGSQIPPLHCLSVDLVTDKPHAGTFEIVLWDCRLRGSWSVLTFNAYF